MFPNDSAPKWGLPGFDATDMAKLGKEQADNLAEVQKEMSAMIEKINADWLARMELERTLASKLGENLAAAKSFPDAAKAYQDWMASRMDAMAKDSQKFLADSQKFAASMMRFFPGGGKGSGF